MKRFKSHSECVTNLGLTQTFYRASKNRISFSAIFFSFSFEAPVIRLFMYKLPPIREIERFDFVYRYLCIYENEILKAIIMNLCTVILYDSVLTKFSIST